MRVISGEKKGFPLKAPKGLNTRPTSDKIKGAIFNSLSNYMDFYQRKAVDCFAGSGSLGIEFLSRGGESCTFFDLNQNSLQAIRENLIKTDYLRRSKVVKGNVLSFLTATVERYDIFFIDPPYKKGLAQKVIDMITEKDLLKEDGFLVVETDKEEVITFIDTYLKKVTEKKYGDTKIITLTRS